MIDEKVILKELNGMIEAQKRNVEYAEQNSNETIVYLESRELAAYMAVRDMIKEKSAKEITASQGTKNTIRELLYHKNMNFTYEFGEMLRQSKILLEHGKVQESKKFFAFANQKVFERIIDEVTPISNITAPYVIAALRVLADKLEINVTKKDKATIKIAKQIMVTTQLNIREEKANETNNEKS